MSESTIIQFVIALIAPFMVAYAIGYFIRRSIKLIALLFGMFFFIVGVAWYAGVIDSFSGIQLWVEDVVKVGYDKTQELTTEIGNTADKKADGSAAQFLIILGVTTFFVGLIVGLIGTNQGKGLRITTN